MMRILIAADYSTPASGNFGASVLELGLALRKTNDELVYIFPNTVNTSSDNSWTQWLKNNGFPVYLIDKQKTPEEQRAVLETIIQKHSIDLLHIHFGMFHHIATRFTKELGVRVLIHDHMGFPIGEKRKQSAKLFAISAYYRLHRIGVVCASPEKNKAYLFAKHWYLPNGLSMLRNVQRPATREECRAEIGLTDDDRMCLFLGWAPAIKGLDIAVKAVNILREEDPRMMLGIVGMGDPPKQFRLDYIQQKTGIDPNSRWIRFLPSREDMFAYHRMADVYLSASRTEAFSYGVLEAISQNTPVAVSEIPGTKWCYVYDKAVHYPTEDANACAEAIRSAMNMGRSPSNYLEVVEQYSIEKWCQGMYKIYKEMLS